MAIKMQSREWWGAPKSFTTQVEERKVSWMELFYDLVYVIVISQITEHLAQHPTKSGLLDYFFFFTMIFWGWLNGSLYHDLHGTKGLRSRLMTLWQMMIVAALAITLNTAGDEILRHSTIALMVMQVYITYIWWSVGFYDKNHRKLNKPYTYLYLLSLVCMLVTIFLDNVVLVKTLFFIALVFNYIPPFILHHFFKDVSKSFDLSPSMTERLGLFTIIVFGEVVLGVVHGMSHLHHLVFHHWLNFGLAMLIVFSLWWIFFTLISDRKCKSGFNNISLMQIIYIPTLMSLGMIGAGFSAVFEYFEHPNTEFAWLFTAFRIAFGIYFLGMCCIISFLQYPKQYMKITRFSQLILFLVSLLFFFQVFIKLKVNLTGYLLIVLVVILSLILTMNIWWYSTNRKLSEQEEPVKQ